MKVMPHFSSVCTQLSSTTLNGPEWNLVLFFYTRVIFSFSFNYDSSFDEVEIYLVVYTKTDIHKKMVHNIYSTAEPLVSKQLSDKTVCEII
jgi:hypothetical protein